MKRYAIYFTPPAGGLADAGAEWLGRDLAKGAALEPPYSGLSALTETARRYGFHATMKAPFRLHDGASVEDLIATLDIFAAGRAPARLDALEVSRLGGFLALTPVGDVTELNALAAQTVYAFERFRAPLTEAEIARRNPDALSPGQRDLMHQFGYPYVMDEFRFHMTLSTRLNDTQYDHFAPLARDWFAPHLPQPFPVSGLALVGEDADGVFHQVHRTRLG